MTIDRSLITQGEHNFKRNIYNLYHSDFIYRIL